MRDSRKPTRSLPVAAVLAVAVLIAATASAEEIRVMTSGAFTAPYLELVPTFEREAGHTILSVFGASMGGTPDSIPVRLARGERADVVIVAAEALDDLVREGMIIPGTRVDLVRSRIGMVVRAGAPRPDISSVDAFVRTLLEAQSIAFSASASGTYLSTELFPRLGIADRIQAKTRRIESERVGTVVARGEAEIGFQQISELLPIPGVDYVGPLPDAVQRVSTFSAGIAVGSTQPAAARRLIDFLTSPAAMPSIRKYGLDPVADASETPSARREASDNAPQILVRRGAASGWSPEPRMSGRSNRGWS